MSAPAPRRVVSVSLGSSTRDHAARATFFGRDYEVARVGADGSVDRALALLARYDGEVDAIGLGGIDVRLRVGEERYALRDGLRLLRAVRRSPAVDGGGVKATLERRVAAFLRERAGLDPRGARVLMVSALDRFGMARAFVEAGAEVLFGDFVFALDLDRPVRDLAAFEAQARRYLPDACRLPFQFLYPTGRRQELPPEPKYPEYYDEAEILAGDFHLMRRYMPASIAGKTVVTNTVTAADAEELRRRGARRLITTTPEIGGRSFGANVLEAILAAELVASGATPPRVADDAAPGLSSAPTWPSDADCEALIDRLGLEPRLVDFAAPAARTAAP